MIIDNDNVFTIIIVLFLNHTQLKAHEDRCYK